MTYGARDNGVTHVEPGDRVRLIHPPVRAFTITAPRLSTNEVVTVVDSLPDADGNVMVQNAAGERMEVFLGCLGIKLEVDG